jgi:hypothetical protein
MSNAISSTFLRKVLIADAVTCAAVAGLQLTNADTLVSLLGLPKNLLLATGAFLVGFAILLILMARANEIRAPLIRLVVVGNIAWGLGCIGLSLGGAFETTALGIAYLLIQALTVFALAAIEFKGWRGRATTLSFGSRQKRDSAS